MTFHGHSANRGDEWEPLNVHLEAVAKRAREFGRVFAADEQAFFAALLHDLGKYSQRFQDRLSRKEKQALDHSSLGALACALGSKRFGLAAGLAVEGHHIGLKLLHKSNASFIRAIQDRISEDRAFFTETDPQAACDRMIADGVRAAKPKNGFALTGDDDLSAAEMLDVRMLFSALVDADFLETEAHFQGDKSSPRRPRAEGPALAIDAAIEALKRRINNLREKAPAGRMRDLRDKLLANCIATGQTSPTGAFTLAAPTGAGKTLAMLAFALHHAKTHGLRRIVLAMPFLNIVDQTAKLYEELFAAKDGFHEHFVLEQHSLVEDVGEASGKGDAIAGRDRLRRMLTENWDAPIILTTTVQLLESLHANRPGRCRKLHRLANAVILLDEVQTLPPNLAALTLATLSRLAQSDGPYRSSVVFATATQPAFETLGDRVKQYHRVGWNPLEIVTDPPALFAQARDRVKIEWRDATPIGIDALASELARCSRVLAIVNLKRHATALTESLGKLVGDEVFHLSTNLCAAHRRVVLTAIRERLDDDHKPTRVIATQCVEAGVDLDFRPVNEMPVLYRALAPLDSIAQAAGRANRNGIAKTATMVVFQLEDDGRGLPYPPGYREGVNATAGLLADYRSWETDLNAIDLINDPKVVRKYYERLYKASGRDQKARGKTENDLDVAITQGDFEEVARQYRLIDNNAINIVVPYDKGVFNDLQKMLADERKPSPGFLAQWQRRARLHSVSIFRPSRDSRLWSLLEPIKFGDEDVADTGTGTWFYPLDEGVYDPRLGLVLPDQVSMIV